MRSKCRPQISPTHANATAQCMQVHCNNVYNMFSGEPHNQDPAVEAFQHVDCRDTYLVLGMRGVDFKSPNIEM